MNVKEKFLELTKRTYPHGTEEQLFQLLPNHLNKDQFGNLFIQIGDKPSTMFTCHLDTASYDQVEVIHVIEGDIIHTDGKSILGADDKAGVVILLYLIENNVEGLYYFFLGEERGCIGSRKVADLHRNNPIDGINKVISFDRRGYDSVITHQMSARCCSKAFSKDLSAKLNYDTNFKYVPDSTGIYTDSAQFVNIYAECTNISVGYHNEHTKSESQNIDHLTKLCERVININWDTLIVERDPHKSNEYEYEDEYHYGIGYSGYNKRYKDIDNLFNESPVEVKTTILDTEYFGYETKVTYDYNTLEILEVKGHVERTIKEKQRIDKLLIDLNVDFEETLWDGNTLIIKSLSDKDTILERSEITEYLPQLNDWIETEIKYNNIS